MIEAFEGEKEKLISPDAFVRIRKQNKTLFVVLDSNKKNYAAALQITPDEKYLLVSNRGDENIAIFNLHETKEQILSVKEHLNCHGSFTRYFTFDPTGKFLLVANQKSNNLICFSYNSDNGTYTFVSQLNNIPSPQHLIFL